MAPRMELKQLTPKFAQYCLSKNEGNRALSPTDVKRFKGIIKRGEWSLMPDALCFDVNGALRNGQHRCTAVSETGVTVPVWVFYDADPEAFQSMDQGRKRSLADSLGILGHKHPHVLATAINLLWKFEIGLASSGTSNRPTSIVGRIEHPSVQQGLEYLEQNPNLVMSVNFACGLKVVQSVLPSSCIAFLHYMFCMTSECERPDEMATDFFNSLDKASAQSDPRKTLWARLMLAKVDKAHRLNREEQLAIAIKCWNKWAFNRKLSRVNWTNRGKNAEPFPAIA